MTGNLFVQDPAKDFIARAASPKRELGAYEALWAKEGTWFKSIADAFREQPGAIPSDFVSDAEIEKYAAATGRTSQAVRARLEKDGGISRLYMGLRREKAVDFLRTRATILEE